MMKPKLICIVSLIILLPSLFSFYSFIPPVKAESSIGKISYKPDIIDQVNFSYVNHSFVFSYNSYYMVFRPYFQYAGSIYTLQQALTFLQRQYPNTQYRYVLARIARTIHWGFNYTNLPSSIQTNLQAIYLKLEDYNFPLSNVELETYLDENNGKNYTVISISKANLAFNFQDIISQDFNVKVNKTGIAIYNVSGKVNLFLDPVTYSAPVITVTGYTAAAPCTFKTIYDADVAGGWGVVFAQATLGGITYQYAINANLVIGNGTALTYFKDSKKQVCIYVSGGYLYTKANSYFQLGLKDANGNPYDGCYLSIPSITTQHFLSTDGNCGFVYFYDSLFYTPNKFWRAYKNSSQIVEILGCTIQSWYGGRFQGAASNIADSTFHDGSTYGLSFKSPIPACSNVLVTRSQYGFYYYPLVSGNLSISDFENRDATTAFTRVVSDVAGTHTLNLVNAITDAWSFSWSVTAGTPTVYRQYNFDTLITFPNGTAFENANVTLMKGSTKLSYLTFANGTIPTQTLTKGYYAQATGNTIQDAGDWNLTITSSYANYTTVFPINEKTSWRIALIPSTSTEERYTMGFVIGIAIIAAVVTFCLFIALKRRND